MNMVWILAGGFLVTYLTRLSFILILGKVQIPAWVVKALRLVPAAVFSAIIAQEVLIQNGSFAFRTDNPRILAGFVATLVAWKTKNTIITILAGMAVLLIYQLFLH